MANKNKQVGNTTNIENRKSAWKQQYPRMKNFKIRASGLTKAQAQSKEDQFIKRGYDGHPGGKPVPGKKYAVYTFDKS